MFKILSIQISYIIDKKNFKTEKKLTNIYNNLKTKQSHESIVTNVFSLKNSSLSFSDDDNNDDNETNENVNKNEKLTSNA